MKYYGKLYGKLVGKYFDTSYTTHDWDAMEKRIKELEAENQALRQKSEKKPVCDHKNSRGINLMYSYCPDCMKCIED